MLKISTSYELRGQRIHQHKSLPNPTQRDLTDTLKHIAWVAGQTAPEIEISESTI